MDEEMNGGVMEQEEAAPASDVDNIDTNSEPEEVTEEQQNPIEQEDKADEPEPEQKETIPNHVWAASRRRAEEEAKNHYDREIARRCAGKVNPATGKPIKTMEDYWAAIDAQNEIRRRNAVEQASKNLDAQQAAALRDAIMNDPEKEQLKARLDDLEQRELRIQAQEAIENDVREISKIDPSIKSVNDIFALPEYPAMEALVQKRGYSLIDAYKVQRFEAALNASEKSGKQAAINAAKSKSHLAAHGGNTTGKGLKSIPADMLSQVKDQFPGKSMDELTKLYNETIL